MEIDVDFPPCPFWDFSLQAYGSDGVAPACLSLQERHGIDVNILLYCVWAGQIGNRMDDGHIALLAAAVNEWHGTIVLSLRRARKQMKTALDSQPPSSLTSALRAQIQKLEIDAEHIEQLRLHAALEGVKCVKAEPGNDLAQHNAERYFSSLNIEMSKDDHQNLLTVCGPANVTGLQP